MEFFRDLFSPGPGYIPTDNPFDYMAVTKIGRVFFYVSKIFLKFFGYFLILMALSLITFVTYIFYTRIVFMMSLNSVALQCIFVLLSFFFVGNIYFNYIRTILINPGEVPKEFKNQENQDWNSPLTQASNERESRWSKYCNKCQHSKPARAHHCHLCDKCVLRMDHHCPWICSCVGYNNHRFFVSFIFYLWVCCTILSFALGAGSFGIWPIDEDIWNDNHSVITFILLLTFSLAITLGAFSIFHIYLILTNQTSIEFQFNKMKYYQDRTFRNPYDLGYRENLRQIFGNNGILSYFLPTLKNPPLNGYEWPTIDTIRFGNRNV